MTTPPGPRSVKISDDERGAWTSDRPRANRPPRPRDISVRSRTLRPADRMRYSPGSLLVIVCASRAERDRSASSDEETGPHDAAGDGESDAALDARAIALEMRETDLALRAQRIDERDRMAERRDAVADQRDREADEREHAADRRERIADEREGTAAARELERLERVAQREARERATARRQQAAVDREVADSDRAALTRP